MPYDEKSFLAGVAAGRNMKSIPWLESEKSGVFSFTVLISATETSMTFRLHHYFMGHIWWGDGTEEDATSFSINARDHTYSTEGIYTITLFGAGWEFRANNSVLTIDRPLLPVPESMVSTMIYYPVNIVEGCLNIRKLPERLFTNIIKDGIPLLLPSQMFSGCVSLEEIPKRLFEGAEAANPRGNIDRMCRGCTNLKKIPDDLFANEQFFGDVTSATRVFQNCRNLEYIPGNLMQNLQNVTTFEAMFDTCNIALKQIPEGLFSNLSSAVTFDSVFVSCTALEYVPLDCFANCPNAASFREAFAGGHEITSPVPALWNAYPDADGSGCFRYCTQAANYSSIPSEWR